MDVLGVLSMEKSTDCSVTATDRWLSPVNEAKKKSGGGGRCPIIINSYSVLSNSCISECYIN